MTYNPKNLLLYLAVLILTFQHTKAQQINSDFLDSLLIEYDIPSISVAYFENNEVSYIGTHGFKSMDTKEPVEKNTIYSAASLSKPAFAYAVLLIAQSGKIDLDEPLYKYLENEDIVASTIISNPLDDSVYNYRHNFRDERIGQWTNIKEISEKTLMEKIDSSTRRNIRKAIKQDHKGYLYL